MGMVSRIGSTRLSTINSKIPKWALGVLTRILAEAEGDKKVKSSLPVLHLKKE